MKKTLLILLVISSTFVVVSCDKSKDDEKNDTCNLDQELTGYSLTEEFCINLVRDCWDCSKGASWVTTAYGCETPNVESKVLGVISDAFEYGIDAQRSYYKNRVLKLQFRTYDPFFVYF